MTQASTRILPASARHPSRTPSQAQTALVAGGENAATSITPTSAAQRPGIIEPQPRRRQPGADALERSERALALRLPQRERDGSCDENVSVSASQGDGGCRSHDQAGSAPARGSASETRPAARQLEAPAARLALGSAATTRTAPTGLGASLLRFRPSLLSGFASPSSSLLRRFASSIPAVTIPPPPTRGPASRGLRFGGWRMLRRVRSQSPRPRAAHGAPRAAGAVGASVAHELRNALAVAESALFLAQRDVDNRLSYAKKNTTKAKTPLYQKLHNQRFVSFEIHQVVFQRGYRQNDAMILVC